MNNDISSVLQQLLENKDLSAEQMSTVMRMIMSGEATSAQIAGFLIALRNKGESVDEIAEAAMIMRDFATDFPITGEHLIDTCGTGGDGLSTFNISTASAFVVAAAGGVVVKHGNRSVSSSSGSADVLEAAGVNLELSPDQVKQCVDQTGIGFLFAPVFHGAMKHAAGPRCEMGVRTLFNLLGPLSNPALAPNQVLGVFSEDWVDPMIQVLQKLGSRHALVVHAEDGLDEISIATPTHVAELKDGWFQNFILTPEQFGLMRAPIDEIQVDGVQASLLIIIDVFAGKKGPARDIVALNAGAAIYTAGLTNTLEAGVQKAIQILDDGSARLKLNELVKLSRSLKSGTVIDVPVAVEATSQPRSITAKQSTQIPDVLQEILTHKQQEVEHRKKRMSTSDLESQIGVVAPPRGFYQAMQACVAAGKPAVIAEIKKASPSKGVLRERFQPIEIAQSYEKGGACCLSVLTDQKFFQGSEVFLQLARQSCNLPVLRKDFIIDPYQVVEARAIEADCILLIVAALSDEQMKELVDTATRLNMDVLVEVHNESELNRALNLDVPMLGINNRNLKTFETRLVTSLELSKLIPDDRLVITESGIQSIADVSLMRQNSINAFLVGETFMKAEQPGDKLKELFGD